jgi:acyl-CoA synthetase (AMP-forming)/AMP-acid ligase II
VKIVVLEAYAMTEAAHQMTSNPLPSRGPHKPGTVGQAQGGVSVTILNLDTKLPCPNGVAGEISIKGTNVFSGYKGRPLSDAFNEEG